PWTSATGSGSRWKPTTSACGRTRRAGQPRKEAVMPDAVLRGSGLWRVYGRGRTEVKACQGVDLHVEPGELLVVKGPSGSGKTTLLNLLGVLDRPTSGQVFLDGVEISAWS